MLRKENIDGCGEVHILDEKPMSDHPGDHYLSIVLAYLPKRNEWVTWIHNKSFGGYGNGHYFWNNEEGAYEDFANR